MFGRSVFEVRQLEEVLVLLLAQSNIGVKSKAIPLQALEVPGG